MAEDARIITVKKMEEQTLANERQAGADREARAEGERAAAKSETERVTREAEGARIAAQVENDRVQREAEGSRVAALAETDRLKREHEMQMAAGQAEADRLKGENDLRTASAATEADRLRRENDAQKAGLQADLDRAAIEKAKAEAEKTELRVKLLRQFNVILETRDTARGLLVNMSDVLFDTGKHSLRPGAREKLARVAGIISAYPGLRLEVEGHTDSVGGDDYNQQLSEQRASSVRDYLTQAGIPMNSVTAKGFGKTLPVASNNTTAGRQQNRRVELVVSGEVIGTEIGSPIAAK